MKGTCKSCENFSALRNECHANPPVPFLVGVDPARGPMFASAWPPTGPDHSCGAYKEDVNVTSRNDLSQRHVMKAN